MARYNKMGRNRLITQSKKGEWGRDGKERRETTLGSKVREEGS